MEGLRQQDLRRLTTCLGAIYTLQDSVAFPAHMLSALATLVPQDFMVRSYCDVRRQAIICHAHPPDTFGVGPNTMQHKVYSDHPEANYFLRTRDHRALRVSDFLTQRQLYRRTFYNEVWRPYGSKYDMCIWLPVPPPALESIVFTRSRREFSDRDVLLLNLLSPHLIQAAANAEAVSRVQQELAQVRDGMEATGSALIGLAQDARVRLTTPAARALLAAYFEPPRGGSDRLPETLERWARQQGAAEGRTDDVPRPHAPLVIDRGEKRLVVRLLQGGAGPLLILEEQRTAPDPVPRERFGLTRREAEVLAWVAQGKTNGEIGTILGLSHRTVEKHLERTYQKLGVETRTAAAACALSASAGN